jgi:HAD superfamily hydrolase (TIGR01509 family)
MTMNRFQLILDIGGVLATNLTGFWRDAAASAGIPYEELRALYKKDVREALWSGRMAESDFWNWLNASFPLERETAYGLLKANLRPLPALARLPEWGRSADIHLLSNHRAEWIVPILEPVRPYIRSMTISSEAGCFKPHPDIYRLAASQLTGSGPALYVDDQVKNLAHASALGWQTLLADERGDWIGEVDMLTAMVGKNASKG